MPFRIIGYIGKPIGLKGKFCISDPRLDAQALRSLKYVYVGNDTDPEEVHDIRAVETRGRRLLLLLDGIGTRKQAESLLHKSLFISEAQMKDFADEHEAFRYEGYEVLQNGEVLGTVSGRIELPMQEVLVITTGNGKEVLVPFVGEFILSINDEARCFYVKLLEGMLDED